MNIPAVHQQTAVSLTASDTKAVVEQVKAIQNIMNAVMKDGVHYGIIPGCQQPSLYKQGSEVLLSAFKIAVEPEVQVTRDGDHIHYQVRAIGRHMTSGIIVGIGVGEASTAEDKYAWRAAVCDAEFEATPETRRRVKFGKKKDGGHYEANQVRTNPADIANTVLKMAKKRAQIDMTLTALSASDCFSQDLEDLPEEYRDGMAGEQQPKKNKFQPKERSGSGSGGSGGGKRNESPATDAQVKMILAKLENAGKPAQELCEHFKVSAVPELPESNGD